MNLILVVISPLSMEFGVKGSIERKCLKAFSKVSVLSYYLKLTWNFNDFKILFHNLNSAPFTVPHHPPLPTRPHHSPLPTTHRFPPDPTTHRFPPDPATHRFPPDPATHRFPPDPTTRRFPQDPATIS